MALVRQDTGLTLALQRVARVHVMLHHPPKDRHSTFPGNTNGLNHPFSSSHSLRLATLRF